MSAITTAAARRRLLDPLLLTGTVAETGWARPRLRRIVLAGDGLRDLAWTPGQQVRVQVAGRGAALDWLTGLRRTYSVLDYDGTRLTLCVFDHGGSAGDGAAGGPGAAWARAVGVGDPVLVSKPQGNFTLRPGPHHLFVGDETASVAFAAMTRVVPAATTARSIVEVDTPDQELPLAGEVTWLHRHGASAASSQRLVAAVRAADLPDAPGRAYLAGEARTIQLVREHLVGERGWSRRDVLTKPFWTPGRAGLE